MLSVYDFYMSEVQSQFAATQWMIEGGLHIDVSKLIATRKKFREKIANLSAQIEQRVGWTPNTKSSQSMGEFFKAIGVSPDYTKPSKNYPSGQVKRAETDLLKYAQKYPSAREILDICLSITEQRTLSDNFLGMALDGNDYYHPVYRLNGTKSGRFASEGADEGGPQGQNWPHELLDLVIPDNPLTDELTEADLVQAEDMIIAYDANDTVMLDAFNKNVDSHRLKACWAFRNWHYTRGIPLPALLDSITVVCPKCQNEGHSKCNHSERHLCKSCGYAFKYKMGVRKLVTKQLPPSGIYISEREGYRIRDCIVTPPTVAWQENTDRELKRSRWLVNLLGRKREFYGLHDSNGELLREALSWKAQSVVGIIAGRAISRLEKSLRLIDSTARLLTQRHDSVLVSHPKRVRPLVYEAIKEAFYSPINAHGRVFNIPLEFKSGPNWRDVKLAA